MDVVKCVAQINSASHLVMSLALSLLKDSRQVTLLKQLSPLERKLEPMLDELLFVVAVVSIFQHLS